MKVVLADFDLLWRTPTSEDAPSIRIASEEAAGGRSEFSARTADQNQQGTEDTVSQQQAKKNTVPV